VNESNIVFKKMKDPASNARLTFASNSDDIRDYFTLHQVAFKGASKQIRRLLHLLDKSTYVLVASLWEAYCEDVVTECLDCITEHAPTYQSLPQSIQAAIERSIRNGRGSAWDLAGDGWREYVQKRNRGFEQKRNREFAGPKSTAVEELFLSALGIEDLCDKWEAAGPASICGDLDTHIERRNLIVHQFTPGPVVNKADVKDFCRVVARLVAYTDAVADEFIVQTTGESRWMWQMATLNEQGG
jgi:RiboL-PSP-HEPN